MYSIRALIDAPRPTEPTISPIKYGNPSLTCWFVTRDRADRLRIDYQWGHNKWMSATIRSVRTWNVRTVRHGVVLKESSCPDEEEL